MSFSWNSCSGKVSWDRMSFRSFLLHSWKAREDKEDYSVRENNANETFRNVFLLLGIILISWQQVYFVAAFILRGISANLMLT